MSEFVQVNTQEEFSEGYRTETYLHNWFSAYRLDGWRLAGGSRLRNLVKFNPMYLSGCGGPTRTSNVEQTHVCQLHLRWSFFVCRRHAISSCNALSWLELWALKKEGWPGQPTSQPWGDALSILGLQWLLTTVVVADVSSWLHVLNPDSSLELCYDEAVACQ